MSRHDCRKKYEQLTPVLSHTGCKELIWFPSGFPFKAPQAQRSLQGGSHPSDVCLSLLPHVAVWVLCPGRSSNLRAQVGSGIFSTALQALLMPQVKVDAPWGTDQRTGLHWAGSPPIKKPQNLEEERAQQMVWRLWCLRWAQNTDPLRSPARPCCSFHGRSDGWDVTGRDGIERPLRFLWYGSICTETHHHKLDPPLWGR